MFTSFINGSVFDGETFLTNKAVIVEGTTIKCLTDTHNIPENTNIYDLQGDMLAPGFIDIQVNGGGGVMFNDQPTLSTITTMARAHRQFGTTSLFPTLISTHWKIMEQAASTIAEAIKANIAGIRGIHFEGPYINKQRKGVHDESKIRNLDKRSYVLLTTENLGKVITTLAPEMVPESYIQKLAKAGVRVCAGHTAATYEEMRNAFDNGVQGITHLFNTMTPFESRSPGVVGAALENDNCWCGIIVDGYHTHEATLRVALSAKSTGKMLLVTDAMATVGAVDKRFQLNGEEIVARNGRCATASGTLAGSDLDMASAVRNTIEMLHQPAEEALKMASLYPAEFLGMADSLGRIEAGYQADLVHLDKNFMVRRTWIGGLE